MSLFRFAGGFWSGGRSGLYSVPAISSANARAQRVIYKRLRALVEGFIGRVKSRLAYGRLTWQGLENVSIHVSLVLMVVYAVAVAAFRIGRPELRQSVAYFA